MTQRDIPYRGHRRQREKAFAESNEVGAKFQGQLPSEPAYDLLREADNKSKNCNNLRTPMNLMDISFKLRLKQRKRTAGRI
jgi:hypothetical protein